MKRWSPEEIEMAVRLGAPLTTRMRRGKLVVIPDEWIGHTTCQQTIRKRQSKQVRKLRMHPKMRKDLGRRDHEHRTDESHLFSWNRRVKSGGHPNNWAPRLSPHKLRHDLDEGWE